jgi:hypothetical protein
MTEPVKYHRNGTITVWNVYTQTWMRQIEPSELPDTVVATLPNKHRNRIILLQDRGCK